MAKQSSILLVGAGNMGGALLNSWARSPQVDTARSAVIAPSPSNLVLDLCEQRRIEINPIQDEYGYDICILAVKPQLFPDVLPTLSWPNSQKTVFVSIAAGITLSTMRDHFKTNVPDAKVVRSMPNLPSAYGAGMTLLTAGSDIEKADREAVDKLFAAAGDTVWCETEDQLDRLMGVSGCGPAYLFLLTEALESAALANGASADDARLLAEATIKGAAKQLANDGRPARDIRNSVTSKEGTTAEAIRVLSDETSGFEPMIKRAVDAAYQRAQELSS